MEDYDLKDLEPEYINREKYRQEQSKNAITQREYLVVFRESASDGRRPHRRNLVAAPTNQPELCTM